MSEADILALTYYHKALVKRPEFKESSGFDDYEDVEIYKDLPCAISFTKGSLQGETDIFQPIEYDAVLFARPEISIKPGDIIVVDVLGDVFNFLAGEGPRYQSHIQIPLIRKDRA